MKTSELDGSYPRPLLRRDQWTSLDGPWQFAHDDGDIGLAEQWYAPSATEFDQRIEVPFPPESPASQIGARAPHRVVWYRRTMPHGDLAGALDADRRVLIHFGAVDYRARVWFDGQLVAGHVGGQTPFTADVTDAARHHPPGTDGNHVLVVRAEDDAADLEQPRGKQDWREKPHGIWYERTSGIWQSVWTESVSANHIVDLAWIPDVPAGTVRAEITLAARPSRPLIIELAITLDDETLAAHTFVITTKTAEVVATIDELRNGQERARLLWTPEHPVLLDVAVTLREHDSDAVLDSVASYVGLRTTSVGGGAFLLNGQPCYTRSVLDQGYRPDTHLASRGSAQLRAEVELIKAMGFNAVRVHQKAEDPRFLFWADRLGLLVWGETAAAYVYSPTAVELFTAEWMELVRRDRSHPCIVAWVPINESWGVQDIAHNQAQQHFAIAMANLTRALDPTRPVMSNEGWEHVDSDILGLHDYAVDPERLRARYVDQQSAIDTVLSARGPQGRRPILRPAQVDAFLAGDAPLMITEFGGISMSDAGDEWGYATAGSDSDYASMLQRLFDALRASSQVAGFCYTQFMDTAQETNGLVFADGTPKLPIESIRQIVTGVKDGADLHTASTSGWAD